jgi:cyclophilin family peptidyl-prolyl cis-trans isomerase
MKPVAGQFPLYPVSNLRNRYGIFSVLFLATFLFVASPARAADALPDLQVYQPSGWSGPLVLSTVKGTSTDAGSFVSGCHYLDWSIANYSNVAITRTFLVRLSIDGTTVREWSVNGLSAMTYTYLTDFPIYMAAGSHTFELAIDPTGAVSEQNENNNESSRNLSFIASAPGNLSSRPSSHDFGKVPSGRAATKVLTFSNGGPGGLPIETVSLTGGDAGAFTISTDACSGKTLPPPNCPGTCAASCTVTVAFSPSKAEPANAILNLADASQAVLAQVPLTGAAEPSTGDFNGDGRISLEDVIILLKVMAGWTEISSIRIQAGINGIPIGLADTIYLLQRLSGQRGDDLYDLVRIQTAFGSMLIWLYQETPLHRDNFLTLAKERYYNGLIFHRVIDDFVIQGGDPLGTGSGGPGYTICPEFNAALTHDFGAVAAARLADSVNPEKNSSGSQFYIVENSSGTHQLDMNYTVFGKVIDGLSVINTIAAQQTDSTNDRPLTPIVMEKVEVVTYSARQLFSNFGFTVGNQ